MVKNVTSSFSTPNKPIHKVQRFEDFYRHFQDKPGVYKYQEKIKNIESKGGNVLIIIYEDLLMSDSQIAEMLRKDPEALLEDAVEAFKNLLKFQSGAKLPYKDYFVRIFTKDEKSPLAKPIRGLRAADIDQLVWIKGITVRSSTIRPKLLKGNFECLICGAIFEVVQLTSKIKWPRFCTNKNCKAKAQSDFRLISKKSEFIDWQSISIQEMPEDLPPGRIPRSIQAILTHELVDCVKPGDRVKIMGVFRSVIANSLKNFNSNLFKTFLEVNFIDPEDKSDEIIDITKDELNKIENLAKEPLIQKKIARSIAPSIYGREDLKMACALSLFAGTRKRNLGGGYKRGDIHVLFVGDPGTGKSVHGNEQIYVGQNTINSKNWKIRRIGNFIDKLIDENRNQVIKKESTEILKLDNKNKYYTFSINPKTLKTKISRIREVSRHKSDNLIKIITKTGRSVLATSNHSFTTILNGKLQILEASQLNKDIYLPIARSIEVPEEYEEFNVTKYLNQNDLVYSNLINNNDLLVKTGEITLVKAAKNCNINKETLVSYLASPPINFSNNWIRCKNDNTWIPKKIAFDECFGRIVGFFLAEGDIIKNAIRITNYNPEIIDLIESDFIKIFERISRYDEDHTIQFHNASLSKIFKQVFGTGAENKKIPDEFLFTPEIFRRNILSAYFSGDGYIEKNSLYLTALTKSKSLAYSISDLLATVGIFSTIRKKVVRSGEYEGHIFYKNILTGEEVFKFHKKIGFLCSVKKNSLILSLKNAASKSRYQRKDIIPNFGAILKKITSDLGLKSNRNTWQRNFLAELRGKTQRQRAGRTYLLNKLTFFDELYKERNIKFSKDLERLKILTNSDILWDKIEEINTINKKTKVYDIGTDDDHFILANGNLIVHNSEVLKNAVEISPRGLYTSGKGSSAVGLTAAIIKDTETGQMNLEAGAIVLANGGVAAIDEFDKMDSADRSALHEGMEQQTVSIAKAGIVATLKSQTAIIAAANPKSGRFNTYKTFAENINMPPSLLSRFDLIYKVLDKPDPAKDAQMAEHILRNATVIYDEDLGDSEEEKIVAPIESELLKKYIKHARRTCHPLLSEEAKERIKEFYLGLRGQYESEDGVVSILARNLDALVRMSEAYAKMALRDKVIKEDVEEIIKLFKRYLKDTGYDKETGKFDIDMILAGQPRTKINKLMRLMDRLREIAEENEWKALEMDSIIQILELEENLDKEFIKNSIKEAVREGTLYEPKTNFIKFARKS